MTYEEILVEHSKYLVQSSVWSDILRSALFGIAKFLKTLCEAAIGLYNEVYKLLDFTSYKGVNQFIDQFKGLFALVLAASLVILGFMMIMDFEKKPKIAKNFVISIVVLSTTTLFITNLNSMLSAGLEMIGVGDQKVSNDIINSNMKDLLYIDKQNGLSNFEITYPELKDDVLNSMSISQTVNKKTEGISDVAKETFNHYVSVTSDGSIEYKKFNKGWLDLFDPPYYYRYDVDFLIVFLSYISMLIVYICTAYKVVRFIYEIVIHKALLYLYAGEITSGRKLQKIIESLFNTYAVLFLSAVLLRIFLFVNQFIAKWDVSEFTKCFVLICTAFAVVDGPDIIKDIAGGKDAGLSGGFGKLAAGYTLAKGTANAGRTLAFGNPLRGTKGILNNKYAKGIGGAGREVFGMGMDATKYGVGAGAGYAASKLDNNLASGIGTVRDSSDLDKKKPDQKPLDAKTKQSDNKSQATEPIPKKLTDDQKLQPESLAKDQNTKESENPLGTPTKINAASPQSHSNDNAAMDAAKENDNKKGTSKQKRNSVPQKNDTLDQNGANSSTGKKGTDKKDEKSAFIQDSGRKDGINANKGMEDYSQENLINSDMPSEDISSSGNTFSEQSKGDIGELDQREVEDQEKPYKSYLGQLINQRKENLGAIGRKTGVVKNESQKPLKYGYKAGYDKASRKNLE